MAELDLKPIIDRLNAKFTGEVTFPPDNSTFIFKTTVMSTDQGKGIRGNALIEDETR